MSFNVTASYIKGGSRDGTAPPRILVKKMLFNNDGPISFVFRLNDPNDMTSGTLCGIGNGSPFAIPIKFTRNVTIDGKKSLAFVSHSGSHYMPDIGPTYMVG
jgi:hypothetical protein